MLVSDDGRDERWVAFPVSSLLVVTGVSFFGFNTCLSGEQEQQTLNSIIEITRRAFLHMFILFLFTDKYTIITNICLLQRF